MKMHASNTNSHTPPINQDTLLVGVLGNPIAHTASPAMHNHVIRHVGANAIYIPILGQPGCENALLHGILNQTPLGDIRDASHFKSPKYPFSEDDYECIRQLPLRGINITIPFKESLLNAAKEQQKNGAQIHIHSLVTQIGASNTLRYRPPKTAAQLAQSDNKTTPNEKDSVPKHLNEKPRIELHNTDVNGFLSPLQTRPQNWSTTQACILGSGGSAKAIIAGLQHTLHIGQCVIASRNYEKYEALIQHIAQNTPNGPFPKWVDIQSDDLYSVLKESQLVINTTPLGMHPNTAHSPVNHYDWVSHSHICYDIIYNPLHTQFLTECRQKGAHIIGGSHMLAGQGAYAFTLFFEDEEFTTNVPCDVETITHMMEKEVINYVNTI